MIDVGEMVLRLLLSAAIGGAIGIEREVHNRPAGLRTHVLVSLGSALIMLISSEVFFDRGDPARLAAQVVSGIGFLGAGTILRTGNSVNGLTTAASLWVSAGIGLAIGAGYYIGGVVTGIIVIVTLVSLGWLERKLILKAHRVVEVIAEDRPGMIGKIGTLLGAHHIRIRDLSFLSLDDPSATSRHTSLIQVRFTVQTPSGVALDAFVAEVGRADSVVSVQINK